MKKIFTLVALMLTMTNIANAQVALQPSALSVYDNEGNLTDRYQYRYDANGNQIEEIDFSGDESVGNMKRSYTYNADGKMLTAVAQKMENGRWMDYSKNMLSYNADGSLAGECNYLWMNGEWVASHKTEIEYDETQYTKYTYNYTAGVWIEIAKEVFDKVEDASMTNCAYDDMGNITSRTFYALNDNGVRENSYKTEFSYDADGRNTMSQSFFWNDGEWVLDTTERYDYASVVTDVAMISSSGKSSVKKVIANSQVNIIVDNKSLGLQGF